MGISKTFTSIFSKDWEINFLQCYSNGYLKYTEMCNLFQITASDHAELGGISFTDMQQYNQAWVLSRMRIEINELPKWRDTVTVTTWITHMQGSNSVRALEMHVNGKKIAGCTSFWAVLNTATRKIENIQLPVEHFTIFPDKLPTAETFQKLNLSHEPIKTVERVVKISDLDIVNHANNVKYLEWCLDEINPNDIFEQNIATLDMNFMRELHLNDTTHIEFSHKNNWLLFKVSKNNKNSFGLKIGLKKTK
jgi:medium-chain acyl-[acyl-carrier-protein] hydrolase